MSDDGKMSFIEHLEELRKRLIKSAVAVIIGMVICWFFRDRILAFLLSPLYEAWSHVDGLPAPGPLNFTDMLEPFIAYLKLSAVGGLFAAAPFVLFQLWKFVAPGLYPKERRLALPFVLVSSVLFIGGAVMAYTFVFPFGFRFFLNLAAGQEMIDLESSIAVIESAEPDSQSSGDTERDKENRAARSGAPHDAGAADSGVEPDAGRIPGTGPRAGAARKEGRGLEKKWTDAPAPASDTSKSDRDRGAWFWERMISYFGSEDCADFKTAPNPAKKGAKLVFTWSEMRCGEPPKLDQLKRDDMPIQVEWSETGSLAIGEKRLEADDENATPGDHLYKLKIPAEPHAMKLAPVLMVKDYLSLALKLLLAFGVVFELPILISFLAFAGIVNYKQLLRFSRWFVVIAFVVGAVLTPPDALTQVMLAVPLIALYFISVLVAYLFGEREKRGAD
jgi:Tat protein translocase TatC